MKRVCCFVILCACISCTGVCADSIDERMYEEGLVQTPSPGFHPLWLSQPVERPIYRSELPVGGFNRNSLENFLLTDRLHGIYVPLNRRVLRILAMNGLPPESLMDNEVTAIRGTLVYDRDLSVIFRGLPPDDVYTDLETTTINLTESVYRDFRLGGVDIQALQEFVRPGSPLISAMRLQTILDNRLVGRLSRRTHSYFPVEQIETLQPYQATLRFEMPHFPPLDHLAGISRFDRFQLMFAGFWQSVRRCCCCEPLDEDDVINHRAPD